MLVEHDAAMLAHEQDVPLVGYGRTYIYAALRVAFDKRINVRVIDDAIYSVRMPLPRKPSEVSMQI